MGSGPGSLSGPVFSSSGHCPTCGKCPTCGRPAIEWERVFGMGGVVVEDLRWTSWASMDTEPHHDGHGDDGDLLAGP